MDKASYHFTVLDKAPTTQTRKKKSQYGFTVKIYLIPLYKHEQYYCNWWEGTRRGRKLMNLTT
jgi:hypothetical protein